jgi:2-oxoglutarate ferredoxin oxidoreductase subunit delta
MASQLSEAEKTNEAKQEAEKTEEVKPKFKILLNPERCKGCTYCIEFCPKGVLKVSSQINSKGYHLPTAYSPELCVGCKICQSICPDFCIYVNKIDN